MKYDINLFTRIINYIVGHNDEPELGLELKNRTLIEFTCYKDFIDVWINEDYTNCFTFKNITDFLDNLIINGTSLRARWNEVKHISDNDIDYSKEPEEQFPVVDGHILYTPKQ